MTDNELRDLLSEKRTHINTLDDLNSYTEFVLTLAKNNHSYDNDVLFATALIVEYANFISNHLGLTGFQASFLMWEFIRDYGHIGKKIGAQLIDFDNFLFPQYESHYSEKTIPKKCWERMQNSAMEYLANDTTIASPLVVDHWESIVNGKVPFGYSIEG